MHKRWLVVSLVLVACGETPRVETTVEQSLYDCNDPAQRLTCDAPSDPDKHFVCHATGNGYVKLAVPACSSHVAGVSHGSRPADQAPGASGDDVGSGAGLDCECNPRVCGDTCTGAADGTACDDDNACTDDGSCAGGTCQAGPPRCDAGAAVDACNTLSGSCDATTGECGLTPLPEGTACGGGSQCDGGGVCAAVDVVINEVESSGGVPGDWVELYNAGATVAHVGGWRFLDNDNTHTPYVIPAGTAIAPGGVLVLEEAQIGFGLGGADSARLFDSTGFVVDTYAWTAHAATTYGRCPDGTGTFRTTTSSTKGAANDCRVTVTINEIESSGGVPGDWVELVNHGPIPVDVSGWVFRDNNNANGYALPAGTMLAPGAFLVLDEAQFSFGLGSADSARLFDAGGGVVDTHSWTAHAATTYGRCPDGSGVFTTTSSVTRGASNDCGGVTINEIESSGGVPGDWVELYNRAMVAVDVSGWVFRDNNDANGYMIPAGTTIAPGGFLVLEEAAFGFGLGSADSARLFTGTGAVVDAHSWTAHAATTYGRCPDGSGAFTTTSAVTKAAGNACGSTTPTGAPWPGANNVTTVDGVNAFAQDMSGLHVEGSAVWAINNGTSTLYELAWNGSTWVPARTWTLGYQVGAGAPDTEDVTLADGAAYAVAERDNNADTVSRLSILRYDVSGTSGALVATHEWNLTAQLPVVGPNVGFEAITFVPDSFLVASGFVDESTNAAYNPALYPHHGTGLFAVGVEQTALVYLLALDHAAGTARVVATINPGDVTVKALAFDRDVGYLWSTCGAPCANQTRVMAVSAGKFVTKRTFARPSTMANIANEGIAVAPESSCMGGMKAFYWVDDNATDGHSLRRDTIPCGAFIP